MSPDRMPDAGLVRGHSEADAHLLLYPQVASNRNNWPRFVPFRESLRLVLSVAADPTFSTNVQVAVPAAVRFCATYNLWTPVTLTITALFFPRSILMQLG